MEMQSDSLTCGLRSACLPLGAKQKQVLCEQASHFRAQITQKGVLSISRRDTVPLHVRNSHIQSEMKRPSQTLGRMCVRCTNLQVIQMKL